MGGDVVSVCPGVMRVDLLFGVMDKSCFFCLAKD